MTSWQDVSQSPNYKKCLDHGFVGLVTRPDGSIDYMGSDNAIVQAARVSYGAGTKSVREDRGLIRYLMKHNHMTPFEMCQIKFHLRLPIFVMRQIIRHRAASWNEYSGRYSLMTDECYVPELDQIQPQSADNKQGRSGSILAQDAQNVQNTIKETNELNYETYQVLLGNINDEMSTKQQLGYTEEFSGIARELARTVLPVSNYTEAYCSMNLRNLIHFLNLRRDPHAQYEIRVYANAILELVRPLFPLAMEAAEDFVFSARTFSKQELKLLKDLLYLERWNENDKATAEQYGISLRDLNELKTFLEE